MAFSAKLGKGEVMMNSSHEIVDQFILCLNFELELDLVAVQKCLNQLHKLGFKDKKLWLINQWYLSLLSIEFSNIGNLPFLYRKVNLLTSFVTRKRPWHCKNYIIKKTRKV